MKKGFTLVELIAVIGIIGIMSAIFIPNLTGVLSEKEKDIYSIKEKQLVTAAEDYVALSELFTMPSSGTGYVTIEDMVLSDYLDGIYDSSSGNECIGYVRVTDNDGHNKYDPFIICENYVTNKNYCSMNIYNSLGR